MAIGISTNRLQALFQEGSKLPANHKKIVDSFFTMLSPREYQREYERVFGNSNAPPPIKLPVEYEMGYALLRRDVEYIATLQGYPTFDAMCVAYMRRDKSLPPEAVIEQYYHDGAVAWEARARHLQGVGNSLARVSLAVSNRNFLFMEGLFVMKIYRLFRRIFKRAARGQNKGSS